jgi:triosephosphate isomerase
MNKELRKAVIAGNWKMNKNPEETKALLAEVAPLVKDAACEVVACVPFIDLPAAVEAAKGTNIKIGAQNCHWEESGAFTGEIAANMLTSIGVSYVIIGHSERRTYFGETDQTVNQRVRAALDAGLSVILCVGETLEQREQGITEELVALQTKIALLGVTKEEHTRVIIAYEPIWAIGTGRTATSAQAGEVCRAIRSVIAALYDKQTADAFTIQYGGSMNAKNAAELLAQGDVDGGLIGGASLKAADFAEIVRAASEG